MGFLRFLFALSVVIAHSGSIFGYSLIPGDLAVQSFYMISGFYMSLVLNEKYVGVNDSYKLFITSRLIRLYPTYWFLLFCILIISIIQGIWSNGADWGETINMYRDYWSDMNLSACIFLIFTNVFLFFQDIVMFLGLNTETGSLFITSNFWNTNPHLYKFLFIPQAWTIGLELTFYLLAPFLVRRKTSIILLLILICLITRCILITQGYSKDPWNYRFFPNELALFLMGTISYRMYKLSTLKLSNKSIPLLSYCVVVIFSITYMFINVDLKYVLFIFCLFITLPYIFSFTKKSTYDRAIGELSYPIYMCHMLIILVVDKLNFSIYNNKTIVVCTLSIIFSYFINQAIELPIDRFKQRRLRKG